MLGEDEWPGQERRWNGGAVGNVVLLG
jgi:hypothetical protein